MHVASAAGNLYGVQRLLQLGVDVDRLDKDDLPPVFGAGATGNLEVVKSLLEAGCRVDFVEDDVRKKKIQGIPVSQLLRWEVLNSLLSCLVCACVCGYMDGVERSKRRLWTRCGRTVNSSRKRCPSGKRRCWT